MKKQDLHVSANNLRSRARESKISFRRTLISRCRGRRRLVQASTKVTKTSILSLRTSSFRTNSPSRTCLAMRLPALFALWPFRILAFFPRLFFLDSKVF